LENVYNIGSFAPRRRMLLEVFLHDQDALCIILNIILYHHLKNKIKINDTSRLKKKCIAINFDNIHF